MAIVQHKFRFFTGTAPTVGAAQGLAAITSGSRVCVAVSVDRVSTVAVTDDLGNTYTLDYTPVLVQNIGMTVVFYSCLVANAPTQINVTLGSFSNALVGVVEMSGRAAASYIGDSQTNNNAFSSAVSTSFTASAANEDAVACATWWLGGTDTTATDASWAIDYVNPGTTYVSSQAFTTSGAKTATATLGGNEQWDQAVITYKASGGGGDTLMGQAAY